MEAVKVHPLDPKVPAKPMQFPDASAVAVNMLPAGNAMAFDQLKCLVDAEGTNPADPDWLGMLASLGIVRGQPYKPDAATRALYDKAARAAYKMSRVVGFEDKVSGRDFSVY